MYQTRNDLPESARKSVMQLLNDRLAEAIDLQLQAKHAHWNVKGPNCVGLHDLFDRVADAVRDFVDLMAGRGVALGSIAEGTVQTAARRSTARVRCQHRRVDRSRRMQGTALAAFGKNARRAIDEANDLKDADTTDLQVALDGRTHVQK